MKHLIIMFLMIHQITIGAKNTELPLVKEVKIEKSWTTLADTAQITIPSISNEVDKSLGEVMKKGTPINIQLGYQFGEDQYLNQEFEGYIKRFHQTNPIKIELEDAAYLLRSKRVNKVWKKTTLKEVITYIIQDTNITLSEDIPSVGFDKFRVSNINGYDALKKIQEEFGLTAYFRGKTLYVGLAFTEKPGEIEFDFNKNIISENLTYRNFEDEAIEMNAKAIQPDNSVIETTVGEKNGIQKNYTSYSARSETELKRQAQEEIEKVRLGKYEGGVKTFLFPYATFGMTAKVTDIENPSKDGSFLVDKVTVMFSSSGGRRDIQFGKKLT
ncbi:hypothetical protein MY04_4802 [Flammeovirga sp. MY04]|uniref:phage late control D family protein n=1 Tax=Flammeovirga sp. MY04 TaxID=1191459 RepID=UPI000806186E|nr:hypothetical protein [Flammeovirga sp. MY04]ANQ49619.1 hypothetical protein MY04_2245 [Flammeovirga sp. MY04]ANQ52137.1 hypothetical protein MY04_4802 [Flammeovirga sp. MY04]